MQGIKNVVLVHGAWADGSSWSKLIPILQANGLHAVAGVARSAIMTFKSGTKPARLNWSLEAKSVVLKQSTVNGRP